MPMPDPTPDTRDDWGFFSRPSTVWGDAYHRSAGGSHRAFVALKSRQQDGDKNEPKKDASYHRAKVSRRK